MHRRRGITQRRSSDPSPSHSIPLSHSGGCATAPVNEELRTRTALSPFMVSALARLGSRIEAHYGGRPQDIEWAWMAGEGDDEGRFFILQSRPIPGLLPPPTQAMHSHASPALSRSLTWLQIAPIRRARADEPPLGHAEDRERLFLSFNHFQVCTGGAERCV